MTAALLLQSKSANGIDHNSAHRETDGKLLGVRFKITYHLSLHSWYFNEVINHLEYYFGEAINQKLFISNGIIFSNILRSLVEAFMEAPISILGKYN